MERYKSVNEFNAQALEIEIAETKVLELSKNAATFRYSKNRFMREVDEIIDNLEKRLTSDSLKEKSRKALRLYAQKCYAKQVKLIRTQAAFYALLLVGTMQHKPEAEKYKARFDRQTTSEFRTSPGFAGEVFRDVPTSVYPTRVPLDTYYKKYAESIENLTRELVESGAKENYATNVSLRNIAEMTVRYEEQKAMIEEKRASGKKLVYILAHANCSERCQKYQVGGTKHPSGLYSLDGTKGVTDDGIPYLPLEFATDNPEDLYVTKAGVAYHNGCLTGFNCRHRLGDYKRGVKPLAIPTAVIERRRAIETRQREYERAIREQKKLYIQLKDVNKNAARAARVRVDKIYDDYKSFSRENKVAYFPDRIKLLDSDKPPKLTFVKEYDNIINTASDRLVTISRDKFINYALNPEVAPDKAIAFQKALGYNLNNADELIDKIQSELSENKFVYKYENKWGKRYEVSMLIKGPNGKTAKVTTGWVQENNNKRLASVYVKEDKNGLYRG